MRLDASMRELERGSGRGEDAMTVIEVEQLMRDVVSLITRGVHRGET